MVPDTAALRAGGKRALAEALAAIEAAPDDPATLALLSSAHGDARAQTIGLTGPPGVGKSTLIGRLIEAWRATGETVGVIAVDPSSRSSGGALLGDRTRLRTDPGDAGVFVRSMAARDRLGGLAELTIDAMVLMRAIFDRVLVETVGVGQSETDVAGAVDTVVLAVQPGSGDSLQFMKAGIIEIPHIVIVTKSDMGEPAARIQSELAAALSFAEPGSGGWQPPVLGVSALRGDGIAELVRKIDQHRSAIAPDLADLRHAQDEAWLTQAIRDRFGRRGLKRAGPVALPRGVSPFAALAELTRQLAGQLD